MFLYADFMSEKCVVGLKPILREDFVQVFTTNILVSSGMRSNSYVSEVFLLSWGLKSPMTIALCHKSF